MPLNIPKINGSAQKQPAASDASESRKPATAGRDGREMVETVVFVVVLVVLLKMFGAEAFVIPTGSMAPTLLGAHKSAICPQCGHRSTINASGEVEKGRRVLHGACQNCREFLRLDDVDPSGGDRVLVSKFLYEGVEDPDRWDVVVFKCPEKGKTHINFIKRLVGKSNETVKVRDGDIHIRKLGEPEFQIAAKPPQVVMAARRLVFDNDEQPNDLSGDEAFRRWEIESDQSWTAGPERKRFSSDPNGTGWIAYRNIIGGGDRDGGAQPQLVTDFESYNSGSDSGQQVNWVGDLMIDCVVDAPSLAGALVFELTEGGRVYRCRLELEERKIELTANGKSLDSVDSPIDAPGTWPLRFANFDDRLIVWVAGHLAFGAGVAVESLTEAEQGPREQDLTPVRIGSENADATIADLKLYRDIYYSQTATRADYSPYSQRYPLREYSDGALEQWREGLRRIEGRTFEIGNDEFFMLGDNSPSSSDGREWEVYEDGSGTNRVARRLILGRALVLYWPPRDWKFVE